MKNIRIYIIAALMMLLMLSSRAEAKWWIFGQSNEEVSINYLYLNNVAFEEGGPKLVIYQETLSEGMIRISGKAAVKKGKIGGVRVSVNDREKWDDAEFSDNGAFEYTFRPETGMSYIIYVEVMDTAGKTNDVEATRREVAISDESIQAVIRQVLDAMIEAYRNENLNLFMSYVSEEFAGDATNLDRAVRKDFSAFDNIDIRYTINNLASSDKGIFVSLNYNRTVISSRSGETLTDKGITEFVFRNGEGGPKAYSMKNPLIFGLSDAAEVATGTVQSATNDSILVVDESGNAETMPFNDAIAFINGEEASGVESGSNITLVSESHPPAGFDFVAGETTVADGDFIITGGDDTPPAYAYGFLNNGATLVDLGAVAINTVDEAPAAGYTDPGGINFYEGHTYAFKLGSGKYALMEVKSIILTWVVDHFRYTMSFDYKYQPDGSRNMM